MPICHIPGAEAKEQARDKERCCQACVTAVCCLVLFTLVIWGGCAAAWKSARDAAKNQEALHAYATRNLR